MTTRKTKAKQEDISVESTMKSVEILLEKLENSETSLDESLEAFEEGIGLIRRAQKALADAEQRVQLLLDEKGNPVVTSIDSDGEGA